MATERRSAPWASLLLAAACSPPPTATVALAVSPIPADVRSIAVGVIELDRALSVASSTTTAENTTFDLEVPAETPLEFRVVARTEKPGPPGIGAMPAYFGSTTRTIALGSQEIEVGLTIHRAGVLTLAAKDGPGITTEGLAFLLEEEQNALPRSLLIPAQSLTASFVARAGRYRVRLAAPDGEMRVVRGGRGLVVEPETESIGIVPVETATAALDPAAPHALALTLLDDRNAPISPPDVIRTPAMGSARAKLRIEALDGTGKSVMIAGARVHVAIVVDPITSSTGRSSADAMTLPATIDGLAFGGIARFRILAAALLQDARTIQGRLAGNAAPAGISPSIPRRMVLRVADRDQLVEGTTLEIELLDARGLFAQNADGALDLSKSDPWAYFPDGTGGAISRSARGHAERRIARPSGPRGIGVVVRATFTSTAIPDVLTSTVGLPRLELP
jgi:hypothetical protein